MKAKWGEETAETGFSALANSKQTRDKLAPIVGITRDASETDSTLLTHAPSHDIPHENPLKEHTP